MSISSKIIKVISGEQNRLFNKFTTAHAIREQALNAWNYLDKMYTKESIFSHHEKTKIAIETEINAIHNEENLFIDTIPKETYLSWYIPVRKFISSVASVAQL